jgi:WD40 repeat protein
LSQRTVIKGHEGGVKAVAVTSDGRIVSGGDDKTARIWDARTGDQLLQLKGHESGVYAVAVTPDGRVVTGSSDKTVRIWDSRTGAELAQLKGHEGDVNFTESESRGVNSCRISFC